MIHLVWFFTQAGVAICPSLPLRTSSSRNTTGDAAGTCSASSRSCPSAPPPVVVVREPQEGAKHRGRPSFPKRRSHAFSAVTCASRSSTGSPPPPPPALLLSRSSAGGGFVPSCPPPPASTPPCFPASALASSDAGTRWSSSSWSPPVPAPALAAPDECRCRDSAGSCGGGSRSDESGRRPRRPCRWRRRLSSSFLADRDSPAVAASVEPFSGEPRAPKSIREARQPAASFSSSPAASTGVAVAGWLLDELPATTPRPTAPPPESVAAAASRAGDGRGKAPRTPLPLPAPPLRRRPRGVVSARIGDAVDAEGVVAAADTDKRDRFTACRPPP